MTYYRSRRPFIWQDEMTEVREAFRRVARVKRGGYSGFSMWSAESPTAGTLSRNRLRRRQAQFAMELRHLNYKEPPFEAFTHLHNIQGMCNRIKNQETVTERKKRDVDLELRPALLRRPVTASGSSHWERGQNALNRILRPHSAPLRTSSQVPIQYTSPAPTLLYSITHKLNRDYNPRSKKSEADMMSPLSTSSSRDEQNPGSDKPAAQGHSTSRRSSSNYTDDHSKPPRPVATSIDSSKLHSMSRSKAAASTAAQIVHVRPHCRTVEERGASSARLEQSGDRNVIEQLPLENIKQEQDLSKARKPDTDKLFPQATSNDYLESSDVDNSSEKTRSCFSDSSMEDEGLQLHHVLHRGYGPSKRAAKQPFETDPARDKKLVRPHVRSRTLPSNFPKHRSASPPSTFLRPRPSQEEVSTRRPVTAGDGSRQHNKPQTKQEQKSVGLQSKQRVKFASLSERSLLGYNKRKTSENLHSTTTLQASHFDDLPSPPPVPEAVEDSHILVKHSAEPYMDFKNSMLQMIREENLQNRRTELEELFQYYLDLNPPVHRDVLKRVIKDIRVELAAGKLI